MATCSWTDDRGRQCAHDAEPAQTRCIFHLPKSAELVGDFWMHIASYMSALYRRAGTPATDVFRDTGRAWIFNEPTRDIGTRYADRIGPSSAWDFRGFIFPAMDSRHNFRSFVFESADFTQAEFAAELTRAGTQRTEHPTPRKLLGDRWTDEPDISEPPTVPLVAEDIEAISEADFADAHFNQDAAFRGARFGKRADFNGVVFGASSRFADALFEATADFSAAVFTGRADFRVERFVGDADFTGAEFHSSADFSRAPFDGGAIFAGATFESGTDFSEAHFASHADFSRAHFDGPTSFRRTTLASHLLFLKPTLHDRMTFEDLAFERTGALLLWGLEFVHGHSRFDINENRTSGNMVEPAGEVMFRDIASGMDRVSLLRTDIYSDRIHIRFSNVNWNKGARSRKFLLDASFVYGGIARWPSIGLGVRGNKISELFNRPAGSPELECIVQEDVERITREIRRSYENYSCYSDAGDYHIVEMNYRRKRSRGAFLKTGLTLYWAFSNYGESPSRALRWLAGLWAVSAITYLQTGFRFHGRLVDYTLNPTVFERVAKSVAEGSFWAVIRQNLSDLGGLTADTGRACLYALLSLVPGYFRQQPEILAPASRWTTAVAMVEAVLGVAVLTLFLLAVRRRFRR